MHMFKCCFLFLWTHLQLKDRSGDKRCRMEQRDGQMVITKVTSMGEVRADRWFNRTEKLNIYIPLPCYTSVVGSTPAHHYSGNYVLRISSFLLIYLCRKWRSRVFLIPCLCWEGWSLRAPACFWCVWLLWERRCQSTWSLSPLTISYTSSIIPL